MYTFFSIDDLIQVLEYDWRSILVQANEGEGSLPWDRFSHVFDFVQNGNRAFRDNRFEEVNFFASWCLSLYSLGEGILFIIYIRTTH